MSIPWQRPARTPFGPSSVVISFTPRQRQVGEGAVIKTLGSYMGSLTASAARVTREELSKRIKGEDWQLEAWACMAQVGELHYAAHAHANGVSRLIMELVRTNEDGGDVKINDVPTDELSEPDIFAMQAMKDLAGDSPSGLAELQRMAALNLFVAGECMLVGLIADDAYDGDSGGGAYSSNDAADDGPFGSSAADYEGPLTELTWRIYAITEIKRTGGEGSDLKIAGKVYSPDEIVLIRLWNPHPMNCQLADSPVRSVLPILRTLIALQMHISATCDSRMAGAGVFVMPASATALGVTSLPEGEEDEQVNPVIQMIMETMLTPIRDRDSASALVPGMLTVPDDVPFQPYHMTFATPFDATVPVLIDLMIRRLALGLDMPPEVLLGMGDASHWNAWQVQEDNVRTHVMPVGMRLADAWVREYLRPVLAELGVDEPTASAYSLTPDPNALIDRPNRQPEALALYSIGALNQGALLDASGFRAEDSPTYGVDPAVQLAFQLLLAQPVLIKDVGFDVLVQQFRAALITGPGGVQPEGAIPPDDPNAQEANPLAPGAQPAGPITIPAAPGPPVTGLPTAPSAAP